MVPTGRRRGAAPGDPGGEPVEGEVDHRGGVEREELAHDEPAHDRDAERLAELGPDTLPQRERQAAQQRGHRGHHDRAEAQQAGLVDRLLRALPLLALGL